MITTQETLSNPILSKDCMVFQVREKVWNDTFPMLAHRNGSNSAFPSFWLEVRVRYEYIKMASW